MFRSVQSIIAAAWALVGFIAMAVESKPETFSPESLRQAHKRVRDSVEPLRVMLVSDCESSAEAARRIVSLKANTESSCEKIILIKGAMILYAYDGDCDRAEKLYADLNNEVPGMPPLLRYNILRETCAAAGSSVSQSLVGKKELAAAEAEVDRLKRVLQEDPENVLLLRRLGEQYVILDRWNLALECFAHSSGELARIAQAELSGRVDDWKMIGDFWWLRSDDRVGLLYEGYRKHAHMLYEKSMTEIAKKKNIH